MTNNYVAPERDLDAFNCPICGAYAHMISYSEVSFISDINGSYTRDLGTNISATLCTHCNNATVWCGKEMLIPANSMAPMPNVDMPKCVKELYEEARGIVNKSPRGAAALLRLALDKLCDEVNIECSTKKKIDEKIAILVRNGLSEKLQKAFDFVRVTGNDAVHELGIIDVQDNPEIATTLFKLLNFIVEKMITENNKIEVLYNLIPESKREEIKKRNKKATVIEQSS